MEYYLYPPFLIIEPQTSFDKAWEELCRQLLSLKHKTHEIRHRTPPDLGADLIWHSQGIIYQCKATENGQTGSIDVKKIKASIERAKHHQKDLGWQKYVLCTNVDITGKQEQSLREYMPEIEFLVRGYWIDLCKEFHLLIADRFRTLVQVSQQHVAQAISQAHIRASVQHFYEKLALSPSVLLVYSHRRSQVFELPVSPDFSIEDVLIILKELFELPTAREYKDIDVSIALSYSLSIDNKEVPPGKRLHEFALEDRPVVTLWKIIMWYEQGRKIDTYALEGINLFQGWTKVENQQLHDVLQTAVKRCEQEVDKSFHNTIVRIEYQQ